jgi:hypothetical protein
MQTSWKTGIVAVAAALALLGAGTVTAKPHDGQGPGVGQGNGHGHGPGGHGPGGPGDRPGGGSGRGGGNGGASCETVASTIGAFVDAACPCAGIDDGAGGTIGWRNHGHYVRCVAHAVKEAVRAAGAKRRCARGLVRCAARSSCGKSGAVACVIEQPGICTAGACDGDPEVPCLTDADCSVRSCSVVRAEDCTADGGTGSAGSCCTASPSGAFLD